MERGDVFRVTNAGAAFDDHIHVIISDPEMDPDYIIAVNFTSWAPHKDQSCVITRPEYPTLTVPRSCINYGDQGKVRIITWDLFETKIKDGFLRALPPPGDLVMNKIWEGAWKTEHWSENNRKLLQSQKFFEYEQDYEAGQAPEH